MDKLAAFIRPAAPPPPPPSPSPALLQSYTLAAAFAATLVFALYYLFFVPPAKLYSNFNSVPVIKSRLPGLGAVGFFANRYTLCVHDEGEQE